MTLWSALLADARAHPLEWAGDALGALSLAFIAWALFTAAGVLA